MAPHNNWSFPSGRKETQILKINYPLVGGKTTEKIDDSIYTFIDKLVNNQKIYDSCNEITIFYSRITYF